MAIALAIATAALTALALRLPSLLSTLLAAYLALVANVGLTTWALSPFHAVTAGGLAIVEAILCTAAFSAWWLRGRPGVATAGARLALRRLADDPVTLLFLAVAGLALAYELVLALGVPPNNWDSLTYHLSRVAAWHQHDGIHWIANAPTGRMNEFQPLAEQENLFLFVATGSTALFALPQYVAQLAILAAVYGASRRLGFDARAAACSAALLATLSLFALEATTAQNDLVAASFPVAAACLLLGGSPVGAILAGVALGLGVGVKLTTVLAWPVLALLAWAGGRRVAARTIGGIGLGLLAGGVWGYVANLVHTGHLLGHGDGRLVATVSPSASGTIRTAAHVLYRMLDLSVLSNWLIAGLALAGAVAGAVAAVVARRTVATRHAALTAAIVALPLLAPALVLAAGTAIYWYVFSEPVNRTANEDVSAFGPLGTVAVLGVSAFAIGSYVGRRPDVRRLALGLAFPTFLILLAVYARYNPYLTRFLVVPVALTAPLFAEVLRKRAVTAAVAAAAAICVGLTLVDNAAKPLNGERGRPWQLTQADALAEGPDEVTGQAVAAALAVYERLVPTDSCVGAVLDNDEPSYLLWGPKLRHRVFFLPSIGALEEAYRRDLAYVVISTGANAPVTEQFTEAGWKAKPLGSYWTLAVAPGAAAGACRT